MVHAPEPVRPPLPEQPHHERHVVYGALLVFGLIAVLGFARLNQREPAVTLRSSATQDNSPGVRSEDLVVVTRLVSLPDEILPARDWAVPRRWRLPGYTRERASTLLADVAGADSRLDCDASGCSVLPPLQSVAALSLPARSRLYSVLALIEGNPQADDTFYRSPQIGPFSTAPGLPPSIRPLMDSLTWHRDGVPAFTDIPVVCDSLATREACRGFMRAMLSRPSASVSLRLGDAAAVERVASSFVEGERAGVRTRLNAARAAGETTMPLDALLPEWARSHLGTFPPAGQEWTNCFWTSLRFLGREGGPLGNGDAMEDVLRRDFVRVPSAARFGDVFVVRDTAGRPIHSATWLLGGYLYEKNGYGRLQAWRIVPLTEVMMDYPAAGSVDLWRPRGRG